MIQISALSEICVLTLVFTVIPQQFLKILYFVARGCYVSIYFCGGELVKGE